jgi:benzoyl-CoA reductase/2-hydroxyglutaryl-CoA dehydratase subunit BcrC/BadD/HgdB
MAEVKITYPEEYKKLFLEKSRNIHFRDGSEVTPEEIWDYLAEEAPKKYPYAFDRSKSFFLATASDDFLLPAAIKNTYLSLTLTERMEKYKKAGGHVAYIQGGQAIDPYTGAGFVALRPALVGRWQRGRQNGNGTTKEELEHKEEKERGYKNISFEACNTAGYEYIQEGDLDIEIIAPYSALRCSDISYSLEAHRHGKRRDKVSLFLGDYPMRYQANKPWAVEYFSENLRKMVRQLDSISGHTTTEKDMLDAIKLHNKGRKIAIELADLWWNARQPPTNGIDRSALFTMGLLEMHADPIATLDVLSEALEHVKERIEKGIKSPHVPDNPARLFVCGSCIHLDEYFVEANGGIVVGSDNSWSQCSSMVDELGDPYYNLAKATLSYSYEQSINERAAWTVEQVKHSHSNGLIFLYNWGCNTQSAIARPLCDAIKKTSDIPTMIMENELVGLKPEQQLNRVAAFIEMVG